MIFTDFTSQELILYFHDSSKADLIDQLAEAVAAARGLSDVEDLKSKLHYRESMMSTGIGLGLGIPHVRYPGMEPPCIAFGICPGGIPDYESMDGKRVEIAAMIIVGEGQHALHVQLLAQIARLFKAGDLLDKLVKTGEAEEALELLKGAARRLA